MYLNGRKNIGTFTDTGPSVAKRRRPLEGRVFPVFVTRLLTGCGKAAKTVYSDGGAFMPNRRVVVYGTTHRQSDASPCASVTNVGTTYHVSPVVIRPRGRPKRVRIIRELARE